MDKQKVAKQLVKLAKSLVAVRLKPGDRVQISGGSGIDSDKTGVVVNRREIKIDNHGIPSNTLTDPYKPVDWKSEVAIRLDDGGLLTMLKNRLKKIGSRKASNIFNDRKVTEAYLEAALWSSTTDDGEPMDRDYSVRDLDSSSVREATKDCKRFLADAEKALGDEALNELTDKEMGHDFWLTRNGHGAGFWDGDINETTGEVLTKICKKYGEAYILEDDEGGIYYQG